MVANELCVLFLFILFNLNLIVFVPGKLSSLQQFVEPEYGLWVQQHAMPKPSKYL
jgi:hypothetical protein